MKNFILCTTLFVASFAQCQYDFNTSFEAYEALNNPVSINNNTPWNNSSSFPVYFNFDFDIYGQNFTAVNVMAGGGLSFPGQGNIQLRVFGHPDSGYLLEDRDQVNSSSPISYVIEGASGQQILKIQWSNAGFRDWCASSAPNDYVNFQVWLFEEDNHIEVHFGDYVADVGAYGMPDCNSGTDGMQFIFEYDNCNNAFSLTGPAGLPSYDYRNHCQWQPGIHVNGTPASGVVYNLAPNGNQGAGIESLLASRLKTFPNPTNGSITIAGLDESLTINSIEIVDLAGNVCVSFDEITSINNEIHLNLLDLSDGIYLLKMIDSDGLVATKRVIKERF